VIARPAPARLLDLLGAGALLAITGPFLAVAALLIRVTDGAPVLFRQQRLGRGRRPFQILKLRTMTAGQVTPIGGVLRDLGLDELPQLVNVLRGEMALVGPRALTADDVGRVGWHAAAFDLRWTVPPGITGVAQIAPVRRCHPRTTWRLDRRYVLRRSARGDAAIVAASVLVPLLGKRRARRAVRMLAWGSRP
jgi:lipopolysaccharide/colanic/teichoic acid biosynthesis glycosyltransferase